MSLQFTPSESFASRYRIGGRLGAGASGYVFRATQLELGRDVALKLVPLAESGVMRSLERFEIEARAQASLRHPNILRLYDHGVDGDVLYLAMELATGRTLGEVVRKDGALDAHEAIAAGLQVAAALDHVHANGIVHRDVKPDNVFCMEDGRLVLGDLGLALAAGGPTAHTTDELILGTPRYMAPELLRGVPYSPGTDLYALGVLLFEVLAARPPFLGDGPKLVERLLSSPAPLLSTVAPDVPAGLAALVDRLLDAEPERRPATAAEVGAALAALEPSISAGWVKASAPASAVPPVAAPRTPVPNEATRVLPNKKAPAQARSGWPFATVPVGLAVVLALVALRPATPPAPVPTADPANAAPASAGADAAAGPRAALAASLRSFDFARRMVRADDSWRRFLNGPEGANVGARRRLVELAFKETRLALEHHDVLLRLRAFLAAVAGRTAASHPLAEPDLELYLALHELRDLARALDARRAKVSPTGLPGGPLDPLLTEGLPAHWRERDGPTLANPHAISLVATADRRSSRPLPEGPYRSHRQLPGWSVSFFGDVPFADLSDFVARAPKQAPAEGFAYLRYEHPAPLDGLLHARDLEVGIDSWPGMNKARFHVRLSARGVPWHTVAVLAVGRAGSRTRGTERWFLTIDPALVRHPELRLALELAPLAGVPHDYSLRADWLTVRWR